MNSLPTELFQNTLTAFYASLGKKTDPDRDDLLAAYQHIESLWWENLRQTPTVRYLLVGEAPLYGDKQAYIYNPQTPGTAFLGKATVERVLALKGQEALLSSKSKMLEALRNLGLVVVDLFPYAFNRQTQVTYQSLSESNRFRLAEQCGPWHLAPKLEALQAKCVGTLPAGVRYLRLEPFARRVLQQFAPAPDSLQIELACQRKANAPLDVERLATVLA